MAADVEPRKELLGLVRSLTQRVRLDAELKKPIGYLSHGMGGVEATAAHAPEPVAAGSGMEVSGPEPVVERSRAEVSALDAVLAAVGECRRCPLGVLRHRLVFGEGNPGAKLVFVGEAPGADEDAQGRPFVGRAGQLLTKIIAAMGLKREDVYICNILKCRPPGNRNPLPEEIAACEPFLIRQIEAIRPRVICALGSFAAHTLLKSEAPISDLRGRFYQYQGIPLMPTYHPAYLLRNPGAKRQVWEDVQAIMKLLQEGS